MSCKVAIVGSRDFPDSDAVIEYVAFLPPWVTVISGGVRGVDRIAAAAARARGLEVIEYKADWDRYGKSAGFRRNEEMVKAADHVVAFWDGKSRGTEHTIRRAREAKKLAAIVTPDETWVYNYDYGEHDHEHTEDARRALTSGAQAGASQEGEREAAGQGG